MTYRAGDQFRTGRHRRPAFDRPQRGHACRPLRARRSPRSISRANSSATSSRQAAADRGLLQQAIFYAGQRRLGALQRAISAATADLPARRRPPGYAPGPLVVEQYVLTNPALNYAQFLLRAILPTVLHIVIAISAGYAVGSEFGGAQRRRLAGGRRRRSADRAGRQARCPIFGIFLLLMVVARRHPSTRFSRCRSAATQCCRAPAACLLIVGLSLARRAAPASGRATSRFGLSLTGIFCSPAFGFAGVGFPVLAMGGFAHGLGLVSAAALVHADPVRSGGARRAASRFARAASRFLPAWRWLYFGLAWLRLRCDRPQPAAKPAPSPPTTGRRDRHRRRFCRGISARPARPRRLRPDRAGADHLWRRSIRSPISASSSAPFRSPSSTRTRPSSAAR